MKYKFPIKTLLIVLILAAAAASAAALFHRSYPVRIDSEADRIAGQFGFEKKIHPRFSQYVRKYLLTKGKADGLERRIKTEFSRAPFPEEIWGMSLVIYQPGQDRMVIVRKGKRAEDVFIQLLQRVIVHKRFSKFDFRDLSKTRIQLDFIVESPKPINLFEYRMNALNENRFEFGIHGLRMRFDNRTKYFLPGDAYVKSVLGDRQLDRMIGKLAGGRPLGSIDFQIFTSKSYVSWGNSFIRLYRGHPIIPALSRGMLESAVHNGVKHLITHQEKSGKFDYYYDAAHDSKVDHEHPNRDLKKNRYYNILRHSGAALSLVMHYDRYKDPESKSGAVAAGTYLMKHSKSYKLDSGERAAYIYSNRKSKLGGTGLALFFLTEYQNVTGDTQFQNFSRQLMRHLLAQITDTGEFIYYNIYLDKPVTTPEENAKRFSFYYPGEAVCALVNYYLYQASDREKAEIKPKLQKALHFLFEVRPKVRAKYYQSLPSDSWLMMGISRLWDAPELRDPSYLEWVYKDADKMSQLTYKIDDALYPDYVGAYYYSYGDFPYSDGARSEGLMAALELAIKTSNTDKIRYYGDTLKRAAWAEYFLVNTPESAYFAPNPEMTIGGIRFKQTRQWFRIDTIAHVVSFYMRFLDVLGDRNPVQAHLDRWLS
ncbi:MAG: hypothetical protein KC649_02250 [Candidatus Omnitrophica bacterium]|nr:hypothetical protein [Candidatus Omnitrophota bacterium]